MSARVTTDIFCDKCGDWTNGVTSARIGAKKARRIAKSRGWAYRRSTEEPYPMVDLCPSCHVHHYAGQYKGIDFCTLCSRRKYDDIHIQEPEVENA